MATILASADWLIIGKSTIDNLHLLRQTDGSTCHMVRIMIINCMSSAWSYKHMLGAIGRDENFSR